MFCALFTALTRGQIGKLSGWIIPFKRPPARRAANLIIAIVNLAGAATPEVILERSKDPSLWLIVM